MGTFAEPFENPYRPGAGHYPPHLAGREDELGEFDRLLGQREIHENMVLTGLRGVGKTVLLAKFRQQAVSRGWVWVGADMSEPAGLTEGNLVTRLLTDLSLVTAGVSVEVPSPAAGFGRAEGTETAFLTFPALMAIFDATPGLVSDKLKHVLETALAALNRNGYSKVVFAYDEAHSLADHSDTGEYPASVLLEVFQSLQRRGAPFMLVLAGLPTLFPRLVEARTYAERMFRVVTLGRLSEGEQREAIEAPIDFDECLVRFDEEAVAAIARQSGGYPYFIQFICREAFYAVAQQMEAGEEPSAVPIEAIQLKLDTDFFAGRWTHVTERRRHLLWVAAHVVSGPEEEFTLQELVAKGGELLKKPFSSSHANQILVELAEDGLVYKSRFGRYMFAVPLLGEFILRTVPPESVQQASSSR